MGELRGGPHQGVSFIVSVRNSNPSENCSFAIDDAKLSAQKFHTLHVRLSVLQLNSERQIVFPLRPVHNVCLACCSVSLSTVGSLCPRSMVCSSSKDPAVEHKTPCQKVDREILGLLDQTCNLPLSTCERVFLGRPETDPRTDFTEMSLQKNRAVLRSMFRTRNMLVFVWQEYLCVHARVYLCVCARVFHIVENVQIPETLLPKKFTESRSFRGLLVWRNGTRCHDCTS